MIDEPYLIRMGRRLSDGLADLETERRDRHRNFILSQQMSDGGFSGREGDSDLYYTSFAVRGLSILGGISPAECDSIGTYLVAHSNDQLGIVDLISWLYSVLAVQASGGPDPFEQAAADWPDQIAERLESVRTDDGGYAKSTEGAYGSTYHSFLVALTYELLGREIPKRNALVQFIFDRQRDDGGFVEIEQMKRSGTNPTAAAVAMLTMFDAMDEELREDVIEFMKAVRSSESGFQANTRIPFADGLSTFTGLLTLQDLQCNDVLKPQQALKFITEWLEFPTGGFRGASWDEQADVEYTFYGLGTLALCGVSANSA